MNILFLNNYNYLRGGSEQVYFGEMSMMKAHGHEVGAFARRTPVDFPSELAGFFPEDMKTDSLSLGFGAFRTLREIIYSTESKKCLGQLLGEMTPDVVHAHNIYGRLTTSTLDLLNSRNIPIVMTLHDYKLICPSYKLMCNGRVCEACKGKKFFSAIWNKCHKNSRIASAVYAFESWFNDFFKKYEKNVDFFIAPSRFLKSKLFEFGIPDEKIVYIPNYIPVQNLIPTYTSENYLVYIGRLSAEKGISTLIRAFRSLKEGHTRLMVVGDGPMREPLEALAGDDGRIQFTGFLSGRELADITRNARAVVVPSEWYENAPISILEAFAFGKPVIGGRIGGIPEMVEDGRNGLLFESGNADDLFDKLNLFLSYSSKGIMEMGQAARKKAEAEYNPELHYEKLIEVYQKAIDLRACK
ncbi:MAG: glycosyltransferase family 4 protein [Desulfobacula sp.]|jgi:glycosyltransferase involved in cell wall biosynthesis